MNEQRCATCSHWNNQREDFRQLVGFRWKSADSDQTYDEREAEANAADMLYGKCEAIKHGDVYVGDDLPLAMTKDASDYQSMLYTQAEFGCALWAAKGDPAVGT